MSQLPIVGAQFTAFTVLHCLQVVTRSADYKVFTYNVGFIIYRIQLLVFHFDYIIVIFNYSNFDNYSIMRPYLLCANLTVSFGRRYLSNSSYKKVTHCIFDLDGLLIDTEKVYKQMMVTLCGRYDHEYTDELMMKVLGGTEQRLSEILCKELRLPITPEQFRDQLLVLGDTMLAGVPLLPGAERLIRHLHASKVPFALATSSSARSVETKLANYTELFQYFHHKVMGSTDPEVKFGKPHPDIFLVTASRFPDKPDPQNCLVFEDSPHGVTAAVKANMQSVMVPEPDLNPDLTKHATIVLQSLHNFKPELFGLPPFK